VPLDALCLHNDYYVLIQVVEDFIISGALKASNSAAPSNERYCSTTPEAEGCYIHYSSTH